MSKLEEAEAQVARLEAANAVLREELELCIVFLHAPAKKDERWALVRRLRAALSDGGEGCEHEFTGGEGAYAGQWSRCLKCKQMALRPAGEGWLRGLPFNVLVAAWIKAQPEMVAGIREGAKAMKEGRVTPWEDVERELFGGEGWLPPRAIHDFVERVNRWAEIEVMKTGVLEGAHHRAIEAELAALDALKGE